MFPHSSGMTFSETAPVVAPNSIVRRSATPSHNARNIMFPQAGHDNINKVAPTSVARKPGHEGDSKPLIETPPKRGTPKKDTSSKRIEPNPQHRDDKTQQPIDQTAPSVGHQGSGDQHGRDGTSICSV
jgi:hypothetical protein